MNEYKKIKLPILAIIGFMGLIACASIGPISLIFHLGIGGFEDGILIGSIAAFFVILIMISAIEV